MKDLRHGFFCSVFHAWSVTQLSHAVPSAGWWHPFAWKCGPQRPQLGIRSCRIGVFWMTRWIRNAPRLFARAVPSWEKILLLLWPLNLHLGTVPLSNGVLLPQCPIRDSGSHWVLDKTGHLSSVLVLTWPALERSEERQQNHWNQWQHRGSGVSFRE